MTGGGGRVWGHPEFYLWQQIGPCPDDAGAIALLPLQDCGSALDSDWPFGERECICFPFWAPRSRARCSALVTMAPCSLGGHPDQGTLDHRGVLAVAVTFMPDTWFGRYVDHTVLRAGRLCNVAHLYPEDALILALTGPCWELVLRPTT